MIANRTIKSKVLRAALSDIVYFSDTPHNLLILHLIALMCEKLGHSILKNAPQMLYFIQSTLKRACAIKDADEEGLGTAFVTETLTMALGMLSAMLGGAVEVTLLNVLFYLIKN